METTFQKELNKLKAEHEALKRYMDKKTREVVWNTNEAALQTKNFAKVIKLSGFSYRAREVQGINIGPEECKTKHTIPNPPPFSPLQDLGEEDKLLLSNVESDDDSSYCDANELVPHVIVDPPIQANPLVEYMDLERIKVMVMDLVMEGKNPFEDNISEKTK